MTLPKKMMLLILILFSTSAFSGLSGKGYNKDNSNGIYAHPEYRSNSDVDYNDNWSTKGNINPHAGQEGTVNSQYNK